MVSRKIGKISRIRGSNGGFSLIEVLVAAVLLAFGLTGLSLMMMKSVQGTAEARDRTWATMEASSLAELILMNPGSLGHFINPVEFIDCGVCAEVCPVEAIFFEDDLPEQWAAFKARNTAYFG